MRRVFIAMMALSLPLSSLAQGPRDDESEVMLRAGYASMDFGTTMGFDLGGTTDISLVLNHGWMLSDNHELGIALSYAKQDYEGGDIFEDSETDASGLGGFYQYNVRTSGNITPFFGAYGSVLGGDTGEVYNFEIGAEGGIKIYPFEHGGVVVSLSYSQLSADDDEMPDASIFALGAGLLLKY